jgi:hypothetical protein
MILQLPPDATPAMRLAADALLFTHIGGGVTGVVSGFAAVAAKKGGRIHRWAGNLFFVAMIAMAVVGAGVAPFLPEPSLINVCAGLFTLYLLGTAWMTARRPAGTVGRFEIGAAGLGAAAGLMAVTFVVLNLMSAHPVGPPEGVAPGVFGAVLLLGVGCDVAMIRAGGITGAARTARHLWRMLAALFVACGSAAAQPRIIPSFARHTDLPLIFMLTPLVLLIGWMVRVRLVPAVKRMLAPRGPLTGPAASRPVHLSPRTGRGLAKS